MNIRWEKEGGQLPPGRSVDDSNGLLVIRDVKVSDSGIYVCQVSDGINIGRKKVTLTVGGSVNMMINFNCFIYKLRMSPVIVFYYYKFQIKSSQNQIKNSI